MRGELRARHALLVLFVCVAGCDQPTDPIPPSQSRLVIQGVIDAGSMGQTVMVERISESNGHQQRHVPGADVTITMPDGRVARGIEVIEATESGANLQMYFFVDIGSSSAPVVLGGTYTLRVHTPAGEDASGTTTVPSSTPFEFPTFVQSLDRARDTVRLAWERIPGAGGYQVSVRSTHNFPNGTFSRITYTVFTDTTISIAAAAKTFDNDEIFISGTSATVSAVAVDDNYYTYYHPVVDPFAGAPASRLTGAVGVFGSVVPVKLVTYLNVR